MAAHFLTFDLATLQPDLGSIEKEKVIAGNPQTKVWNFEESPDGKLFAGVWEASPGKWRVSYDEWEYCQVESGHSVVTDEKGQATVLKAGDSLILRPGFQGTWEVVETTRKTYVIRLP
jgi:uncharacterized cupin superfamily protein